MIVKEQRGASGVCAANKFKRGGGIWRVCLGRSLGLFLPFLPVFGRGIDIARSENSRTDNITPIFAGRNNTGERDADQGQGDGGGDGVGALQSDIRGNGHEENCKRGKRTAQTGQWHEDKTSD